MHIHMSICGKTEMHTCKNIILNNPWIEVCHIKVGIGTA